MFTDPEKLSQVRSDLQRQIQEWEKKLQELIKKQAETQDVEALAKLILEYDRIEREIEDRSHVFSLLSEPPETMLSPYFKSGYYSYIEAAETASPELVHYIAEAYHELLRQAIEAGEDDTVDLIQTEYREYILPGEVLAGKFDELDRTVDEMNRSIQKIDPKYLPERSSEVVYKAFRKAIDSDVRVDPILSALKQGLVQNLTVDQRNDLINYIGERLSALRFEDARKQQVAMEKALAFRQKKKEAGEWTELPPAT